MVEGDPPPPADVCILKMLRTKRGIQNCPPPPSGPPAHAAGVEVRNCTEHPPAPVGPLVQESSAMASRPPGVSQRGIGVFPSESTSACEAHIRLLSRVRLAPPFNRVTRDGFVSRDCAQDFDNACAERRVPGRRALPLVCGPCVEREPPSGGAAGEPPLRMRLSEVCPGAEISRSRAPPFWGVPKQFPQPRTRSSIY